MSEPIVVVVGGPSPSVKDRGVPADELRPVQVLTGNTLQSVENFPVPKGQGVSNIAAFDEFLLWTSGSELLFGTPDIHRLLDIPGLDDIHEITVCDNQILVANTSADEVIVLDRRTHELTERLSPSHKGTHHLNQAFVGLDGARHALVHHIEGRELRKRLAGRILKMQGDGGVINLETGELHHLRLTAPHSVRLIDDKFWILDSGRARIVVLDKNWQEVESIQVGGWGRGAALSKDGQTLWVGLSPLRPRYRGFVEGQEIETPTIAAVDIASRAIRQSFTVRGVDQINGVHLVANRNLVVGCRPA